VEEGEGEVAERERERDARCVMMHGVVDVF
jgi:hypothetical protein